MKSAGLLLVLGCVGSLLACGDLGDEDTAPLAVIQGQLTQASLSSTPSNVRVAVIWSTGSTGFKTSMDIPAVPVFPSQFRLELRDPPPASVMEVPDDRPADPTGPGPAPTVGLPGPDTQSRPLNNRAATGAYAVGTVVAYEDLDGDGRLGLIDANTPPTDRILGANDELLIVYAEGDLSGLDSPPPARGYNLYRSPRCTRGTRTSPPECPEGSWLPISTPYELPLTAEPQLAQVMCSSTVGESYSSANKRIGPAPAPGPNGWPDRDDPGVVCSGDGKSYEYFRCTEISLGLCRGTSDTCDHETWTLPSATPPAEWPCTIE